MRNTTLLSFAYHKRHAEFIRHNIVKNWVDRRGDIIEKHPTRKSLEDKGTPSMGRSM